MRTQTGKTEVREGESGRGYEPRKTGENRALEGSWMRMRTQRDRQEPGPGGELGEDANPDRQELLEGESGRGCEPRETGKNRVLEGSWVRMRTQTCENGVLEGKSG